MSNTTSDVFFKPTIPDAISLDTPPNPYDKLKNVYWDENKRSLYWIEWEDTGNGETAHKHHIATIN